MPKFKNLAKIVKGNKPNFESNPLTKAIAERQAKQDIKRLKKSKKA